MLVDQPVFPHVAKHARRTVNPPNDTWVAFGLDKRGYKKDVHFKIAVSRHAVRLLFEVGPEYYDKPGWSRNWSRDFPSLASGLGKGTALAWFRDEHDEEPAATLSGMDRTALEDLGREPVRKRDGQLVIGRRLDEKVVPGMTEAAFRKAVTGTFRPLAPLFLLHDQRVLASRA
jgi:uncharacterized protein YktB (UPF0637 family)